jgi:hypothetical protein
LRDSAFIGAKPLFVPLTAFTINDFCRASAKAHATRDSSPYNG